MFGQVNWYNIRLNPTKCTFSVGVEKFLGFILTSRGIEANSKKCVAIQEMRSPQILKEAQRLVGRVTSLPRFIPELAKWIRLVLKKMKKVSTNKWDDQCEAVFAEVKAILATPPFMACPVKNLVLQLYLAVAEEMVSTTLV